MSIEADAAAYIAELDKASPMSPVNTTHFTRMRMSAKHGAEAFTAEVDRQLAERKDQR